MTDVLGVISARGGSKALPRKNVACLGGKPLIAHTIEAALGASLMGRVVVSTDDAEIAAVSRRWGAETPFMRPSELAGDESTSFPVLAHAVRWLSENEGYEPAYAMLLQPTSPLRTSKDIDGAITLALEKDADSVVSVYPPKQHPHWMKTLDEDGRLSDYVEWERDYSQRRTLPPVFALNGAIFLVRHALAMTGDSFYTERSYGYVMPPERSLDIDTAFDLEVAELALPCPTP